MSSDIWKIRIVCALLFAFVVSAYFAYGELQYALWGKTIQAQLLDVRNGKDINMARRAEPVHVYEYSFTDDKLGVRTEKDMVPTDWTRPDGNAILVQYIPGEKDSSRLEGHHRLGSVLFFLGVVLAGTGFIVKLAREANEPIRGSRSSNRAR